MILLALIAAASLNCDAPPVREFTATGPASDRFAVMLTGDGGWRPVDRGVTEPLVANGIPIVGFITSDYYRKRRSAEESACALEQVIRKYQQLWKKDKVMLIGFSRGADCLPFMINRLSPEIRASIVSVALLGPEPSIDFEYHPFWSLLRYIRHPPQFPVRPEIEGLQGLNVLCVYGERESDSLCPTLEPAAFKILREPGGHHYAGRYHEVGRAILDAAQ